VKRQTFFFVFILYFVFTPMYHRTSPCISRGVYSKVLKCEEAVREPGRAFEFGFEFGHRFCFHREVCTFPKYQYSNRHPDEGEKRQEIPGNNRRRITIRNEQLPCVASSLSR
jgi:hypothetical protein